MKIYIIRDNRNGKDLIHSIWTTQQAAENIRKQIAWTHIQEWTVNEQEPQNVDAWLAIIIERQKSLKWPIMPAVTDEELQQA